LLGEAAVTAGVGAKEYLSFFEADISVSNLEMASELS
jgi:hypothetical protein